MLIKHRRINKLDLATIMLYIAVFKFYVGSQILQQIIKITFIGIVLIFFADHTSWKQIFNRVTLMILSFIASSLIGTITGDVTGKAIFDGILYAICIYCIYITIQKYAKKNKVSQFINITFNMTAIYCFISLISIYIVGVSRYGTEKEYFFGNKFSTCYFFILFTGLYYVKNFSDKRNYHKRIVFVFLAVLSFFISCWVYCSTAIIGTLVLILGTVIPDFVKEKLQSKKLIMITMCITGLFSFFVVTILKNSQVQFIFYQLMGKSLGLTGRLHIYDLLPSIIVKRPIFGYGYNSFIIDTVVGYGNAQNGLMELIVNFGFVGMILFVVVVYQCLNSKPDLKNYGLYIVLYTLIFCSTVEISYNYFFYIALFIIFFNSDNWNVQRKRKLCIK